MDAKPIESLEYHILRSVGDVRLQIANELVVSAPSLCAVAARFRYASLKQESLMRFAPRVVVDRPAHERQEGDCGVSCRLK